MIFTLNCRALQEHWSHMGNSKWRRHTLSLTRSHYLNRYLNHRYLNAKEVAHAMQKKHARKMSLGGFLFRHDVYSFAARQQLSSLWEATVHRSHTHFLLTYSVSVSFALTTSQSRRVILLFLFLFSLRIFSILSLYHSWRFISMLYPALLPLSQINKIILFFSFFHHIRFLCL